MRQLSPQAQKGNKIYLKKEGKCEVTQRDDVFQQKKKEKELEGGRCCVRNT